MSNYYLCDYCARKQKESSFWAFGFKRLRCDKHEGVINGRIASDGKPLREVCPDYVQGGHDE